MPRRLSRLKKGGWFGPVDRTGDSQVAHRINLEANDRHPTGFGVVVVASRSSDGGASMSLCRQGRTGLCATVVLDYPIKSFVAVDMLDDLTR